MPYRNNADERTPGRPRDTDREAVILGEVNGLLNERGYDGITFEEVARRAGASKATLYRRWETKRDMVIAALKAGPARRDGPDEIDTGTLRGDLLGLVERLLATLRSTDGKAALLLLQAGIEDPAFCNEIERAVGPTGARLSESVLDRAVARGELPVGANGFSYDEIVGSALLLRRLNGLVVDEAYVDALVDTVVIPALHASATADQRLPTGIFSADPAHDQSTTERYS